MRDWASRCATSRSSSARVIVIFSSGSDEGAVASLPSRTPFANSRLADPSDRASSGSFLLPNINSAKASTMSSSGGPRSTQPG